MDDITNKFLLSMLESAFLEKYDASLYEYTLDEVQEDAEVYLTGTATIETPTSDGIMEVIFNFNFKAELFCPKLESGFFAFLDEPLELFEKYTKGEENERTD